MTMLIDDILESDQLEQVGNPEVQYFFEYIYELIEGYDLYDADMRIAGLYYRTNSIDTDTMYEIAQFAEIGNGCDLRNAVKEFAKQSKSRAAVQQTIDQYDYVFDALVYEKGIEHYPHGYDQQLQFKREPTNKNDPNAIQIFYKGEFCGYVPKEHAAVISKKYSSVEISSSIGIVRKKVGEARVTFDIYLPKQKFKAKKVVQFEEEDDWSDDDEVVNVQKEPVKEEDKGLYEGQIRSIDKVGYTEEWMKGKWVPWDGTSYYDKQTYEIMVWSRAENAWHIQTKEESDESNRRLKQYVDEQKAKEGDAVAKTYVDANVTGVTSVAEKPKDPVCGQMVVTVNGTAKVFTGTEWTEIAPLASPVLTGKFVKAKSPIPVPLDYTQYTGFLRTVLEYATFAHIR